MSCEIPPQLPPKPTPTLLTTQDHSRDAAGLHYVYPVVSRRAAGVSVGINLNTNNACNWACLYCQVPGLTRGAAPRIDLDQLDTELEGFLREVLLGDFLSVRVPAGMRTLKDLAFSGNGEPTASPDFAPAVRRVSQVLARLRSALPPATAAPLETLKLVLISNGSQFTQAPVLAALDELAAQRGELWFKLDAGRRSTRRAINGADLPDALVQRRLVEASRRIPTWLQTCLFRQHDAAPTAQDLTDYLACVEQARSAGARLAGVLLYTLARPSLQPAADRLAPLVADELQVWAGALRGLGLEVRVNL